MTLRAVLAAVRRNAILIVAVVLICTLVGLVLTYVLPKTYSSETQVLFRPQQTSQEEPLPPSANSFVESQMATIAALATTASVLEPAAAAVGGVRSIDLKDRVSTSVVQDTTIVRIDTKAPTAQGAARLANAVGAALTQQASTIQPSAPVLVVGAVVEAPLVPPYPDSPLLLVDLLVGFFVGLLLAFLAVVVRESLRSTEELQR